MILEIVTLFQSSYDSVYGSKQTVAGLHIVQCTMHPQYGTQYHQNFTCFYI